MKSIHRIKEGTPNRLSRVADQYVDATRQLRQLLQQLLNRRRIRQIAGKDLSLPASLSHLLLNLFEFVGGTSNQHQACTSISKQQRHAFTDAKTGTCNANCSARKHRTQPAPIVPKQRKKQQSHRVPNTKQDAQKPQ